MTRFVKIQEIQERAPVQMKTDRLRDPLCLVSQVEQTSNAP